MIKRVSNFANYRLALIMLSPRLFRHILRPSLRARSTKPKLNPNETIHAATPLPNPPDVNDLGIPMISTKLHRRLFGNDDIGSKSNVIDEATLKKIRHRIVKCAGVEEQEVSTATKDSGGSEEFAIELPELHDETVEGHFTVIAEEQVREYRNLAQKLATSTAPMQPKESDWIMKPGWTKYGSDGSAVIVDFPQEDAIFFDVEVSRETKKPTLAVAMSEKSW